MRVILYSYRFIDIQSNHSVSVCVISPAICKKAGYDIYKGLQNRHISLLVNNDKAFATHERKLFTIYVNYRKYISRHEKK